MHLCRGADVMNEIPFFQECVTCTSRRIILCITNLLHSDMVYPHTVRNTIEWMTSGICWVKLCTMERS